MDIIRYSDLIFICSPFALYSRIIRRIGAFVWRLSSWIFNRW